MSATSPNLVRGVWRSSVAIAFVLTLFLSGGVLIARLTRGMHSYAWLAALVVTFGAVLCATSLDVFASPKHARARRRSTLVTAHALGALAALLMLHTVVVLRGAYIDAALVERPSQIVNDGVLVGAVFGLCWSLDAERRLVRIGLPILCLGLVGVYFATAERWHLDGFPGLSVQHYVAQQCLVIAGALFFFDLLRSLRKSNI